MIKSLTVTNHFDDSLTLNLRYPDESGLLIKNIEGLGPNKSNINLMDLATADGGVFTRARVPARNVVISLIYLFDPTIEDARQKTYRYFPLNKLCKFRVVTDNRDVVFEGYIESNEPNIFSEREEAQISILCPDPHLYAQGDSATIFSGVRPLFEFPFSNESTSTKLLEMGEILVDTRAILSYEGDADTGVIITIHAIDPAENISLYNVRTRESMHIDTTKLVTITGDQIRQGDDIIISTIKGNKYMRLLRDGKYTNIISALNKDADWFQLQAGDNLFNYTAEYGAHNLFVTFEYRNAYWGI